MSISNIQKIKGKFKDTDIISLHQFDLLSFDLLFNTTTKFKKDQSSIHQLPLRNKIAALLFYEPSSRTFSSFAAAAKRLGGQTIEYQNPLQTSSAVKGETMADTVRVFANYADILIIRHFEKDTALSAAFFSPVPVINAGDGIGEHPTQALLDMFTLHETFGRLDGLTGVIAGDLLYGRTVHSLIAGLSMYKKITLYLLSPKKLRLQRDLIKKYEKQGIRLIEIEKETDIPKNCDFWYWTRVQKERFSSVEEYEKLKNSFIITPELLNKHGNKNMIIMHPLPRVGEIDPVIDDDPRAVYLTRQIKNGVYVRMALLSLVLGRI